MDMMKTAADHLLRIADEIDKEAAEHTVFGCTRCFHTASLAKMNAAIFSAAKSASVDNVPTVGVNDEVECPECSGVMAYHPTEASERYYVEDNEDVEASSLFDLPKSSAMMKEGPAEEPQIVAPEATPEDISRAVQASRKGPIDDSFLAEYAPKF